MTKFKLALLAFLTMLFISACSTSQEDKQKSINTCPQCSMELPESHIHTSKIKQDEDIYYFDDPGCMILWAQKNDIKCEDVEAKVFANDTKRYIDVMSAYYAINEKTPMLYGFSAYEKKNENVIDFKEVQIRMLRGEHMANPKIRKYILGY